MSWILKEIDLDGVFVESGTGFGPPGFELEPPPSGRFFRECRYEVRIPVGGSHTLAPAGKD